MQGRKFVRTAAALVVVLGLSLIWTGCATAPPPANVKTVDCAGTEIQWDVAPEAEITNFACTMGESGGDPALIFTVGLKNVASSPLRYRLSIFLAGMDKAVSYLVPRTGKPPQLAAGKEETVKIPFAKTTAIARKILVRVAPMSSE